MLLIRIKYDRVRTCICVCGRLRWEGKAERHKTIQLTLDGRGREGRGVICIRQESSTNGTTDGDKQYTGGAIHLTSHYFVFDPIIFG